MNNPPINELLIHRGPMLLIDRVEQSRENWIACSARLGSDCGFAECGRVPAVVMLEYMAQCAGAYVGLVRRRDGSMPRLGYLVGVRDLELLCDHVEVGQPLHVEAKCTWAGDYAAQFECLVNAGGGRVAQGVLNVYEPEPEEEQP